MMAAISAAPEQFPPFFPDLHRRAAIVVQHPAKQS